MINNNLSRICTSRIFHPTTSRVDVYQISNQLLLCGIFVFSKTTTHYELCLTRISITMNKDIHQHGSQSFRDSKSNSVSK
jgi:hypothetical protein